MKTSVLEVHDLLSVFAIDEVEKRIGEVPGVESVTVNFAAGNATIRFDETRLEAADIKSAVRQRGFEAVAPAAGAPSDAHEDHAEAGAPPAAAATTTAPDKAAASPATPNPATPDPAPAEPPAAPAAADSPKDGAAPQEKAPQES